MILQRWRMIPQLCGFRIVKDAFFYFIFLSLFNLYLYLYVSFLYVLYIYNIDKTYVFKKRFLYLINFIVFFVFSD